MSLLAPETHQLSTQASDRARNTATLLEVPGLAETITPQLGNCIFIPGLEDDFGKEHHFLNIDIDGKPQLFCKPRHAVTRSSLRVESGEAFDAEGAAYLFRHVGGIPLPYKAAALSIAMDRQDDDLLNTAFTREEQQRLALGMEEVYKILGPSIKMVLPQLRPALDAEPVARMIES